jgi:hypothetical protein
MTAAKKTAAKKTAAKKIDHPKDHPAQAMDTKLPSDDDEIDEEGFEALRDLYNETEEAD